MNVLVSSFRFTLFNWWKLEDWIILLDREKNCMTEKLIENDEYEPRDVCNKGQTWDYIESSHAVVSLIIVKGHFSSSALRDPYQRSGWTTNKFVPKRLSLMKMCHKNSKVKRDVLLQKCHWHESSSTAPSKAKSKGLGTRLSPAPEVFSVVVSLRGNTSVVCHTAGHPLWPRRSLSCEKLTHDLLLQWSQLKHEYFDL